MPNPRLRGYLVWVPKLGGRESDVDAATRLVPDQRVRHFWDENGLSLRAFQSVLGLPGDAWDVYLLYGPEARWTSATPPRPGFWMHQLNGVEGLAPLLDPEAFAARAESLLAGARTDPALGTSPGA